VMKQLQRMIRAERTSDGAGVSLYRSLGQSAFARVDPFLMLDEFGSDNPNEYIAGFPPHPHRGFETVTYMLEGHMLHEDHLGNRGHLRSGGVQWMTAGRGIIHSEMPQQEQGMMRGFQLWINLPAREKMKPAGYQDIQADQIPVVEMSDGRKVKVIAGRLSYGDDVIEGPVNGVTTDPIFFDVHLPARARFAHKVPQEHSSYLYVYEGGLCADPGTSLSTALPMRHGGVLGPGDEIVVQATDLPTRFLLLAAMPLKEPVVQLGPFVMNTREEIEQAVYDYQHNQLVSV